MELQFKEQHCTCLQPAVREVQNLEQTQELKLTDGMPDIGRILNAWGQTVLRSKEWRDDRIAVSGGVMVWVLYAPEDGSQVRCLESWIPFQMQWELPTNTPEGSIRIQSMLRFADARSVSARKILVRCGLTALAEVYSPMEGKWYTPENVPEEVQLLRRNYPMRLPREAGEKTFSMEEEAALPPSAPVPEKLLYYGVYPSVTDCKLLGDRLLFRGNLNLHVLYVSEEGQLHSWDFELPFSQFAQLEESYTGNAQSNIRIEPTNLELELLEEGQLLLKAGLTAQYLIEDMQMMELVEDAYSPERSLNITMEKLSLPAVLDSRQENLYGEQKLPEDAAIVVDVCFLPGFPRQQRNAATVTLLPSGVFQVLYYAQDGSLQSTNLRWEGKMEIPADEDVRILTSPVQLSADAPASGSMTVRTQLPIHITTMENQGIPMVTGLEMGQPQAKKADRPSLILRRAGDGGLWVLAKSSGSTMDAIRQANHLESEPQPGQMLLIPVG